MGARPMMRRTAQSHAQGLAAVAVLCVGAIVNAIAMSPYTIAIVIVGYLLALTSYSFTPGEKRFAMIGVPIAAFLFYAFGLFLARGRSTGHDGPLNSGDTWQAAKDGFAAVPTMLGLLGALYLLWRLFKAVAKSG
jgi:4-hydroxybenzoate polyprenyltransferase